MTNSAPTVTMVLFDADGNRASVEIPGPGGTIRCGVGEPGKRSGVWRVWANPTTSDVYVGVRNLLGEQKWSLHESGDWRHQWVNRERVAVTGQRIIDQWSQPAPMGDTGWTRGFSIWVRHEDVIDVPDDDESRTTEIVWVPTPPQGLAVGMHVVVATPNGAATELRGAIPVAGFMLADGRVVLLVTSREKTDDATLTGLDNDRARFVGAASAAGIDLGSVPAPRILISTQNENGDRIAWDLAARPLTGD